MTLSLFALDDGSHSSISGGEISLTATQKGELAEMMFMANAVINGWHVFIPHGHAQMADMCLVRPSRRPLLVQVKTASRDIERPLDYAVNVGHGSSSKSAYQAGAFDVLAAYLPDRNEFVMWTLEDLKGRVRIRYSPERHRQPNNWALLDDVAQSLTNSGSGTADVRPPTVHLTTSL